MADTLPPRFRHPLSSLSEAEFRLARDIIIRRHAGRTLFFRAVHLEEPAKTALVPFLVAEHSGQPVDGLRPPRLARVQYDLIKDDRVHEYTQSIVNLDTEEEVDRVVAGPNSQPSFTVAEFSKFQDACVKSELFRQAMSEFTLPEGFNVTIDPWPYGGLDNGETPPRYMQGLVFARDARHDNLDSNHYAYPIPIIPVMDWVSKEVVRVDRLPTSPDSLIQAKGKQSEPRQLFANHMPGEYVPELLGQPLRSGMKPINITQPDGASFTVDDGLIEWQKWRFRIGFTPREGVVIHDICYENRPILYRLSYSELTVPYADPRSPFHRKQAFDLGDGGVGRAANNLQLGCDCLGAIHYLDYLLADPEGNPTTAEAVVCLHEQDNGIGWKHTNYRTGRAVVTRLRELVVQFVVTLANYEYVLAYKFDVAGGITVETRATGIVSVVAIDDDVSASQYGTVVAPGVLAQNHQHIFAVRIDPTIDSYQQGDTVVVAEESLPQPISPSNNPHGNFYSVERQVINRPLACDAETKLGRVIRLENAKKKNAISGRNIGYKFMPSATQLLLANPDSVQARRAGFARHHVWVTGYRDGELWAAGEFTNQSRKESGGVSDMVKRRDWFVEGAQLEESRSSGYNEGEEDREGRLSSPVVWSVFGFTHNPRVEDWPVMPVEIHQLNLRPADFFTCNPALDVPSAKNDTSVRVSCCGRALPKKDVASDTTVQQNPITHMQGARETEAQESGATVDGKPQRLANGISLGSGTE